MTAPRGAAGRRFAAAALVVATTAWHLVVVDAVLPPSMGRADRPAPIDVQFVQTLQPAAPPTAPVRPAVPAASRWKRLTAAAVAEAASAARSDPPAGDAIDVDVASTRAADDAARALAALAALGQAAAVTVDASPWLSAAPEAAADHAVAGGAESPAAAADGDTPLPGGVDWPPSTRLRYALTGNYRGDVLGQAEVQWRRSGRRYQVEMQVSIGPSFAPVMTRRVASDGEITDDGLRPSRFDEETRVAFGAPRRLTIVLGDDHVRLPGGASVPRPAGVQDSGSQFVQLTWLFTTRPERLVEGGSVELPLALPRSVQTWTYDVRGRETLTTRFGDIDAFHVVPRRPPQATRGDLAAEIWFAPTLQYLPVRIVVRQSADTWIDLLLDELPTQAAVPPR